MSPHKRFLEGPVERRPELLSQYCDDVYPTLDTPPGPRSPGSHVQLVYIIGVPERSALTTQDEEKSPSRLFPEALLSGCGGRPGWALEPRTGAVCPVRRDDQPPSSGNSLVSLVPRFPLRILQPVDPRGWRNPLASQEPLDAHHSVPPHRDYLRSDRRRRIRGRTTRSCPREHPRHVDFQPGSRHDRQD